MIRIFKEAAFARDARRAGITDAELCKKVSDLLKGTGGVDMGGGVWKVKLRNNDYRAIIIENKGIWLIYVYLFEKQDEKNISSKALLGFRKLLKDLGQMKPDAFEALVKSGRFIEICRRAQ
ncbi:MAG: type II toxin-antitoxin system RelE/ParE family toxin [Pararobbsia sp.]